MVLFLLVFFDCVSQIHLQIRPVKRGEFALLAKVFKLSDRYIKFIYSFMLVDASSIQYWNAKYFALC